MLKCSHGSTSGSIDENSIYYLMTRGISEIDAKQLLIKGFLADFLEKVKNQEIKMLFEENLERQVNGKLKILKKSFQYLNKKLMENH
jgi:ABC-type transport system involved in Fe-S cluster assembly, permease component